MSKSDSYIHGRSLFETSKLTRINEVIRDYMELKSFPNHLFKELSNCIEKNYGAIQFGRVKHGLIRLRNTNCGRSLEMRWPMFQIYTSVSNINEFANAIFTSDNRLQITPG